MNGPQFLVTWFESDLIDHFTAHETFEDAKKEYDSLIERENILSVSISGVVLSTDYKSLKFDIQAGPLGELELADKPTDETEEVDLGVLYCNPSDLLGAQFSAKFEKDKSTRSSHTKAIP